MVRKIRTNEEVQNVERNILQKYIPSFPARTICETSLQRGSLTVEAAWAVPLFFLCVVTLVCMIRMYGAAAAQYVTLQEYAERTGMAAGTLGESVVDVIDLTLPASYEVNLFPGVKKTVRIACRARVYPWTGRTDSAAESSENGTDSILVLVTENESVYHTDSRCTHLTLNIQAVSASRLSGYRNSSGSRYHACDKCVREQSANSTVFISEEGDCYHNSAECSGLTRHVRLVPQSEVGTLRICSRCENTYGDIAS